MKRKIKRRKIKKRNAQHNNKPDDALQSLLTVIKINRKLRVEIALKHFRVFAYLYFGLVLSRAQIRWAHKFIRSKRALVLAPRGHGKTELTKILVIWLICRDRDVRVLLTSKTHTLAKKNLGAVRFELTNNKKLIRDFGKFYSYGNVWEKMMVYVIRERNSKDPTVEAAGILSAITGSRFDYIILDDIIDDRSCINEEQRRKIRERVEGELIELLEPNGAMWAIGTRKHFGDIYGTIMKNPVWSSVVDKAIIREPNDYEVIELDKPEVVIIEDQEIEINVKVVIHGEDRGICLWKEHIPMEHLLALKYSIDSRLYNREYQNKIVADEYALIAKEQWLEDAKDYDLSYMYSGLDTALRGGYFVLAQGCDPAIVVDEKSAEARDTSYYVNFTLASDEKGNITVLGLDRFRGITPAQAEKRIKANYYKFSPDALAIESNSFGEFHISNLVERTDLKIVKHHTGTQKHDPYAGVPSLSKLFEHRKIKVPYKTADDKKKTDALLNEIYNFGMDEHTDQVMALWIANTLVNRLRLSKNRNEIFEGERPDLDRDAA